MITGVDVWLHKLSAKRRAVAYIRPPQTPRRGDETRGSRRVPQSYRIPKFVVITCGLASALPTQGSIQDHCYEYWWWGVARLSTLPTISVPSIRKTGTWYQQCEDRVKVHSHIACRAHVVPMPCRAAKGLECVFPI